MRYAVALLPSVLAFSTLVALATDSGAEEFGANVLPRPPQPFAGKVAPTEEASIPGFPERISAPSGAPNILLVLTDDVGFGAASTFGGPVPTPNLDRLAAGGLRYNRFHTTAICSPTRAALLTGRNHHAVGTGSVVEMASPYPGYRGYIPPTAATVARILRDNGYNTAMFGKDHNVPAGERSQAGPFNNWPTSRGFEYFYGFIGGDTNQWQPGLFEGTNPVDTGDRPKDYLLDAELADRAIRWVRNQQAAAPERPFFIYYAPGSAHAPHQAPADWIARFRGQFDGGWDKLREMILARQQSLGVVPAQTVLAPRPDIVPAWDSLSDKQRKVYARFMEVFAAQLSYQDAQFGRIMAELERMGIADNTLVIFIEGDNGASSEGGIEGTVNEMADLSSTQGHDIDIDWLAEHLDELGGPNTYQTYPVGWTFAMSTPFPWFKQLASHLGGVRNGMVVSWPGHIADRGEVRQQYHHVIDVAPTLLEAAGVTAPERVDGIAQQPLDGISMLYSFAAADNASRRRTQYYEVNANRAIYHDGWLASTTPQNMPWTATALGGDGRVMAYPWELYNLDQDFSQSTNLAVDNPEKLREMQALFDTEARKYNVYPIQDTGAMLRSQRMARGSGAHFRNEYVLWGPDIQLSMMSSPPIFYMSFRIDADIDVPEEGGDGVIVAAGSAFSGWSFYLHEGRPVAYSAVSPLQDRQYRVAAKRRVRTGKHRVSYEFNRTAVGGEVIITVDGKEVARDSLPEVPHVIAGNGETFDTGRDSRGAVAPDYQQEGVFNGVIDKVVVTLFPGQAGSAVH